jgi:hypothetical protein
MLLALKLVKEGATPYRAAKDTGIKLNNLYARLAKERKKK